jgi:hypothetical protein
MNKSIQPGAHLDHMLRQTRIHHVQLSTMADVKGNMLLTVASVVLTLSAPHLLSAHLRVPALILIGFCLLTILLTIIAVMPKLSIPGRNTPKPDVKSPAFNLLFFGDFMRLEYHEFEEAMEELLTDPTKLYHSQLREIYTLGIFLGRKKYRYLKFAYLSFVTGLFASLLSWFILN